MLEIKGEISTAKVFCDQVEESAETQIRALCDMEYTKDSKIRIMPDVHAGAGCTIGTTMTIQDAIVPNLVGVDIGCGMETVRIREKRLELQKLDRLIHQAIPAGMEIRKQPHSAAEEIDLSDLRCADSVNLLRAERSIGTLGSGNHFIEVDRADDGTLYIVVHSGSRHLGLEVANYYQRAGYDGLNQRDPSSIQRLIDEYKAAGREKEIQKALKVLKAQVLTKIPYELAYVSGQLFDDYIHDMTLVQQFAVLNRKAMMEEIVRGMKVTVEEEFTTVHNYIDTESMILRKGAVSAKEGEKLLIPINMRDGSLICTGKGNPDWNFSAPHGAGRLMSRQKARQSFTLPQFRASMEGIYTTSVNRDTIDECPMAYKGMEHILNYIEPTAQVTDIIRPIYNFKA